MVSFVSAPTSRKNFFNRRICSRLWKAINSCGTGRLLRRNIAQKYPATKTQGLPHL